MARASLLRLLSGGFGRTENSKKKYFKKKNSKKLKAPNAASHPVHPRLRQASIAQLAEHALSKRKVASSILAGGLPVRHGVVGNISACHADARGSIPRDGALFFFFLMPGKK